MADLCVCGIVHTTEAQYFASVVDAGRTGLLAGPFATHPEALAVVPTVRALAERRDPWSHFYAFGTVAMPAGCEATGLFNDQLSEVHP